MSEKRVAQLARLADKVKNDPSEAQQANAKRFAADAAARHAAKTHCIRGHELSGANLLACNRGSRRCRECNRLHRKKNLLNGNIARPTIERVIAALDEGKTLRDIGRSVRIPRLKLFCAKHPRLGNKIRQMAKENCAAVKRRPHPIVLAATAIRKNDGHDAFDAVQAATRGLPEPIRGVVQSDMFLDLTEGRLRIHEVHQRAAEYVRKYNRDEKHSVASRWGNRSLDAPIGDGNLSLLDTIEDMGVWSPVAIGTGSRVGVRRSG